MASSKLPRRGCCEAVVEEVEDDEEANDVKEEGVKEAAAALRNGKKDLCAPLGELGAEPLLEEKRTRLKYLKHLGFMCLSKDIWYDHTLFHVCKSPNQTSGHTVNGLSVW